MERTPEDQAADEQQDDQRDDEQQDDNGSTADTNADVALGREPDSHRDDAGDEPDPNP